MLLTHCRKSAILNKVDEQRDFGHSATSNDEAGANQTSFPSRKSHPKFFGSVSHTDNLQLRNRPCYAEYCANV